jgi:glycosyltransferase involved in cell wall biosynthesis
VTEKAVAMAPKLSIVTTTHNQEAYVRQAFDSFVAQQTNFPVEIVVADDASTDATPSIIREYTSRYPHLFRPILRPENLGLNLNLTGALSAARGEYIALCEGDDYWTDPLKLSKQVAFLDQHPDTAVCFHPVRVVWEDNHEKDSKFPPAHLRGNLSVEALILMNFIQTNSAVYRRLERYDDIPADVMPLDWHLHVRHAARGDIAMLPKTMAVYRRHAQGMWHNQVMDPPKFWLAHGPGHAATFDAMLDLFPDDPVRQELIAAMADWILRQIANVPGPEGRAALRDTMAKYPRMAELALKYRWAPHSRRLRASWRRLAFVAPSPRGLVDVWPFSLRRRQPEATGCPARPLADQYNGKRDGVGGPLLGGNS